jgi:hypothetical protein
MARESAFILDGGDTLPTLTMETVSHGRVTVPDAFGGSWGAFLVYRGHW